MTREEPIIIRITLQELKILVDALNDYGERLYRSGGDTTVALRLYRRMQEATPL